MNYKLFASLRRNSLDTTSGRTAITARPPAFQLAYWNSYFTKTFRPFIFYSRNNHRLSVNVTKLT